MQLVTRFPFEHLIPKQSGCIHTMGEKKNLPYMWVVVFFFIMSSQWEFFPWEIRIAFSPEESQLLQSRGTRA